VFHLLAHAARDSDDDVVVFVASPDPADEHVDAGVQVIEVACPETRASRLLRRAHLPETGDRIRIAQAMRTAVIAHGRFDVVEAASWYGFHLLLTFSRRRHRCVATLLVTPLSVAVDATGGRLTRAQRVADYVERLATRRSDVRLSDSALHATHLRRTGWLRSRDKVTVVPLPAAPVADDGSTLVAADPPIVLQVGSLGSRKRQDLTVEAAGVLVALGTTVQVVLVGEDFDATGPCTRRSLAARAAELGVPVAFESGISDHGLRQLYMQASLVVEPSTYESFGLPVAEALMVGCPVVVRDTVGASEFVDGNAGEVVRSDSVEALTDALLRVLNGTYDRDSIRSTMSQLFDPAALWAMHRTAVLRARG
jgi:glycosyltransferase involved in cell wall biosynthesis